MSELGKEFNVSLDADDINQIVKEWVHQDLGKRTGIVLLYDKKTGYYKGGGWTINSEDFVNLILMSLAETPPILLEKIINKIINDDNL